MTQGNTIHEVKTIGKVTEIFGKIYAFPSLFSLEE